MPASIRRPEFAGLQQGRWSTVARSGRPDVAGAESWPADDARRRATLVIGRRNVVVGDLDAELRCLVDVGTWPAPLARPPADQPAPR